MVDEDAGELLADGLVDQHGGDGGIDATDSPQITRSKPTCFLIMWTSSRS